MCGNNKGKEMKNQNKKSKRVNIECVDDLVDALVDIETSINDKLADLGVESSVRVEEGIDIVNVNIDDKTVFSMRVTDATASSAFGSLKSALERAKKSLMPKVETASVVVDELPAKAEKPIRNDLAEDNLKARLDAVVENANIRLVEIRNGGKIDDVAVCYIFDGTDVVVKAGDLEIARERLGDAKAFYRCRSAI